MKRIQRLLALIISLGVLSANSSALAAAYKPYSPKILVPSEVEISQAAQPQNSGGSTGDAQVEDVSIVSGYVYYKDKTPVEGATVTFNKTGTLNSDGTSRTFIGPINNRATTLPSGDFTFKITGDTLGSYGIIFELTAGQDSVKTPAEKVSNIVLSKGKDVKDIKIYLGYNKDGSAGQVTNTDIAPDTGSNYDIKCMDIGNGQYAAYGKVEGKDEYKILDTEKDKKFSSGTPLPIQVRVVQMNTASDGTKIYHLQSTADSSNSTNLYTIADVSKCVLPGFPAPKVAADPNLLVAPVKKSNEKTKIADFPTGTSSITFRPVRYTEAGFEDNKAPVGSVNYKLSVSTNTPSDAQKPKNSNKKGLASSINVSADMPSALNTNLSFEVLVANPTPDAKLYVMFYNPDQGSASRFVYPPEGQAVPANGKLTITVPHPKAKQYTGYNTKTVYLAVYAKGTDPVKDADITQLQIPIEKIPAAQEGETVKYESVVKLAIPTAPSSASVSAPAKDSTVCKNDSMDGYIPALDGKTITICFKESETAAVHWLTNIASSASKIGNFPGNEEVIDGSISTPYGYLKMVGRTKDLLWLENAVRTVGSIVGNGSEDTTDTAPTPHGPVQISGSLGAVNWAKKAITDTYNAVSRPFKSAEKKLYKYAFSSKTIDNGSISRTKIENLPAGNYTIELKKDGFELLTVKDIVLEDGKALDLGDVYLKPNIGAEPPSNQINSAESVVNVKKGNGGTIHEIIGAELVYLSNAPWYGWQKKNATGEYNTKKPKYKDKSGKPDLIASDTTGGAAAASSTALTDASFGQISYEAKVCIASSTWKANYIKKAWQDTRGSNSSEYGYGAFKKASNFSGSGAPAEIFQGTDNATYNRTGMDGKGWTFSLGECTAL